MNNRGFTLIELLVTITLLGIIISISFISITSIIKQSKINDCETIINNLKSATSEYISDKRYDRAFVSGINSSNAKIVLTANDLINGNYINGDIINPFTKEKVTDYISIEAEINTDYTLKNATINGLTCNE